MAVSKKQIRAAIDEVLEGHDVVTSTYEGSLSDLSIEGVREVIYPKFRGNQMALEEAERFQGTNTEIKDLLTLKEDFFSTQLDALQDSVAQNSTLTGFKFNEKEFKENLNKRGEYAKSFKPSYELQYNEWQRQLKNYGGRSEDRVQVSALRQKISDLDPQYRFRPLDLKSKSWDEQIPVLQDAYDQLQRDVTENTALRSRVYTLDPNYNFKSLDNHGISRQNEWLRQAEQDIPEQKETISAVKDMIRNPNFNVSSDLSVHSQFMAYEKELMRQGQLQTQGKQLMDDKKTSFEDFNKAMSKDPKGTMRALWSVDASAYKEEGQWFRTKVDQQEYNELYPIEEFKPVEGTKLFPDANLSDVHAKGGTEFQQAYNSLTIAEKEEYNRKYGRPIIFTSGEEKVAVKNGDNRDWLTEQQQQDLLKFEEKERAAQELEQNRQATQEQISSLRSMYQEREVKQFKAQETAVENPVGAEEQHDLFSEPISPETRADLDAMWKTIRAQRTQAPDASSQTNEIAENMIQLNTIGETQVSNIERRAANSILMADTARSYTFGYKRKALLGMMGTTGAISLMEASMSGPNREVVERRRQLEEERRRRQLGY